MRTLIVCVVATWTLAACGVPDTGCPAGQPAPGSSCTSLQSCSYTTDAGAITCHCAVAMGSSEGTWQCGR